MIKIIIAFWIGAVFGFFVAGFLSIGKENQDD